MDGPSRDGDGNKDIMRRDVKNKRRMCQEGTKRKHATRLILAER